MKASRLLVAILFSVPMFSGCAHSLMRGSVAMKANDEEAHVCMGNTEVKVGDRVVLYKNVCPPAKGRALKGLAACTKRSWGAVR